MANRPIPEASGEEPTATGPGARARELSDATLHSPSLPVVDDGSPLPRLDEARYQIAETADAMLGRGGQGVVWLAHDRVLRREVALKLLRREAHANPALVAAFLREARLTALLEHPGIVAVHDVGRLADGSVAIVLRRIEGKSLAEALSSRRTLDERLTLVPAVLRACQAVAFAHEREVVHRDLKPQNVMLGAFGETWVLDWGLALLVAQAPAADITAPRDTGGVVGTPAYMSPEQALGLPTDARSDVWGLGACLYQVLTGQPPIVGRSLQSAMGHAAAAEVSPALALEPGVPTDLAAICDKALSSERSARYATAGALANDLEHWLSGRTVSARAYSMTELLWRSLQAHRGLVGVVLAAVLALGVGLGFEEARVHRERNEAKAFARELLIDVPNAVDAQKPNIALLELLTGRAQAWLSRNDLNVEDQVAACRLFSQLATLNADTRQSGDAERLDRQALALGRAGQLSHPDNPLFLACSVEAETDLAYAAVEHGDVDAGLSAYAAAERELDAWRGPDDPSLTLARSALLNTWGGHLWATTPEEGAPRFIESARLSRTLLERTEPRIRDLALSHGSNGVAALWSQGKRDEAGELARVFYEASAPVCARNDTRAKRACFSSLAAYLMVLAWSDDPRVPSLLETARGLEAEVLERDADSAGSRFDAMLFTFEHGDFESSNGHSRWLREHDAEEWAADMGPIASALAGDLASVDLWNDHAAGAGLLLGRALRDVSRGDFGAASAELRAVDKAHLWYLISWTPAPHPALRVPAQARPAFERFLTDFTRAYGAADMKALGASVDAFAAELDALKTTP